MAHEALRGNYGPITAVNTDSGKNSTPGANLPATFDLASTAGKSWTISCVHWSYSAAPTGGTLVIDDSTITRTYYITAAGPGFLPFPVPIRMTPGALVSVTLHAGGGGVLGTVDVDAWLE